MENHGKLFITVLPTPNMQGLLAIVEIVAIPAMAKRGKMCDMIIQTDESRVMIGA